jgi:hypothetical protein
MHTNTQKLLKDGYIDIDGLGTLFVIHMGLGYDGVKPKTRLNFLPSPSLTSILNNNGDHDEYRKECSTGEPTARSIKEGI